MENKVLSFLKQYNILCIDDLEDKSTLFESREFIETFWSIAKQDLDKLNKYIDYSINQFDDKQFFWFENNIVFDNNDIVSKYSCIFPERTIIESGNMALGDIYGEGLYIDTYKIAKTNFLYDKIVSNNIGYISPRYFDWCDDSFIRGNNVSYINQIVNQETNNNKLLNYLFVSLPWLYNARIEDYIEISGKYKNEFDNYNLELRKIAKSATTKEEFAKNIISNLEEININIRIGLEQKKSQLRNKGITTFVGICFTLIPFVFPESLDFLGNNFISTVFGGGTVYQALNLFSDIFDIKNVYRETPFWVIWKWKEITEKLQ